MNLILLHLKYKIGSLRCKYEGHQGMIMTLKDPGGWAKNEPHDWVVRCPRCGHMRDSVVTMPHDKKTGLSG